jgi:hypothetical protein
MIDVTQVTPRCEYPKLAVYLILLGSKYLPQHFVFRNIKPEFFSERKTSHFTPIREATLKFISKYIEYLKWVAISQSVQRQDVGWTAGVRFPVVQIFSLFHRAQTGSGVHPTPIQWIPRDLSSELKRSGRESDHSTPSSAEVKNGGALLPTPHTFSWHSASSEQIMLHAGCLLAYCSTLKMQETCPSKTSLDFQRTTRRYIPEDRILPNVVLSRICHFDSCETSPDGTFPTSPAHQCEQQTRTPSLLFRFFFIISLPVPIAVALPTFVCCVLQFFKLTPVNQTSTPGEAKPVW